MIEEIIKKIDFFPAFPASLQKALNVLNAPDAEVDDILKAVKYDVAITTNLLKLCNSPLYSFRREISSVKEAIIYAGAAEIKKMVLFLASKKIFSEEAPGYEKQKGEMFKHSIAAAIISEDLQSFAPELEADLFTTCLMLDIGKIILSEYTGKSYKKIAHLIKVEGYDFAEAENEVIGITHPEVGARILQKWDFPAPMIEAVRYHHTPEIATEAPLTHFASLTTTVAMLSGFTTGIDGLAYKGFPALCKRYGIKNSDISRIMGDSLEKIQSVVNQLKI